ncbi:MAG: hypothetical protein ACO1N1_22200 [Dyadobacter fermentans]
MKALFLPLISILLLCSLSAHSQQFPPTTGIPCPNCVPVNYTAVGTPFISDIYNPGIDVTKADYQWYIYMGELDVPPSNYSQGLPNAGGKNSFVSLKTSEGPENDKLYVDVSGFDIAKTYVFRYTVCGAGLYGAGNDLLPYAESATMEIGTVGLNQNFIIESQTTNFVDANSQQHWTKRVITFKPTTSTLRFKLSGKTQGQVPGYVHFSIDKYPFDCQLQPNQVPLNSPAIVKTMFPNEKLNLLNIGTIIPMPAGTELVWKAGPNSSDPTLSAAEASGVPISNQDPANVKPYYAFYYAKDFNCYNVPVSTANVKFIYEPKQVPLKNTYLEVSCTEPKTNLTVTVDGSVDEVVWFKTSDHSGDVVYNAYEAGPGDYYAFYNNGGSFSLPSGMNSIAHVQVVNPIMSGIPDLGPTLLINSLIFPPNGVKDFVVKMQNIKAENSNCSVSFKVAKLPGFNITYSAQAGQSMVKNGMDNSIANNNDFWAFSEDANYITVSSKYGMAASGYSYIGFKITRTSHAAGAKKNLSISIPPGGGGGEANTTNNQILTTVVTN